MRKNKLPTSFWMVISLSILVAVILIISTLIESSDKINFSLKSIFNRKTTVDTKIIKAPKPTNTEKLKQKEMTCSVFKQGELKVNNQNKNYQPKILFWKNKKKQSLVLFDSSNAVSNASINYNDDWEPSLTIQSQTDLNCSKSRSNNCLPITTQNVEVVSKDSDFVVIKVSDKNSESIASLSLKATGAIQISNIIGPCGQKYSANDSFAFSRQEANSYLFVGSSNYSNFGIFKTHTMGQFGQKNYPSHPSQFYNFSADRFVNSSCGQVSPSYPVEKIQVSQKWVTQLIESTFAKYIWIGKWDGTSVSRPSLIIDSELTQQRINDYFILNDSLISVYTKPFIGSRGHLKNYIITKSEELNQHSEFSDFLQPTNVLYNDKLNTILTAEYSDSSFSENIISFIVESNSTYKKLKATTIPGPELSNILWKPLSDSRHLLLWEINKSENKLGYSIIDCQKLSNI